jgi:ethanolamine transporter EutH
MIKLLPVLFAEVCITILGGVALAYGLDGAIFATTIAAIAGLGGYAIRKSGTPS